MQISISYTSMYSSIHLSVFNFCVLSYSKIHYICVLKQIQLACNNYGLLLLHSFAPSLTFESGTGSFSPLVQSPPPPNTNVCRVWLILRVTQSFHQHQFYYNQVTATDTRNLLEYYLKQFKQSIQSKQKAMPSAARYYSSMPTRKSWTSV